MALPDVERTPEVPRWRTRTRSRRIGYRLMGDAFSYVLHLRPREWPIMAAHTALGFVLATGLGATLRGAQVGALLAALFIVVVLINGGTLAINSAFDRDEGDIGYLDSPPPVPARLALVSFVLMASGVALAALGPRAFLWTVVACFVLSLMYSVPPLRLKAVAGADWIINMVGFGTLTPYAGWAVTGRPLTDVGAWTLVAFCPLFAALYPLTQLYQLDEDRARGDRTLAIVVGIRASLLLAAGFALVAFACFARAATLAHAAPAGWGLLAAACVAWLAVLAGWIVGARRMTPADHQRGMYLALGAWAVTDVAVILALAPR